MKGLRQRLRKLRTFPSEDDLGRHVVTSARWVGLSRIVIMATTWITTIALARLLRPSEYGIAGMAMLVVAIFTVFQDSGIHAALIQRNERVQEAVDAATAYTPLLGLLLLGLALAAAPLGGLLFHSGEVTSLVRALGVVFLFRSLSQVPSAIIQKEFMFGRLTVVLLSGALLQMGVVIWLAAAGAGPWSVIVGQIVVAAWSALLLWPLCPMRPHPFQAKLEELRDLLGYGRHIVAANVSGFVNSYVDVAVVGRLLGASALGAYTLGYQTGRRAVATVTYVSNQVIFPAYSKLQGDQKRFRSAYLRSLRFVCVISMPAGFGLAALSSDFVRIVYGERWAPAAPVLAVVALMGIVLSITATMGEVLKAAGSPHLFFRFSLLQTSLVVVGVFGLYRFGITYVALSQLLAVSITGIVVTRATGRILEIDLRGWVQAVGPTAASGALMAAGVLATREALVRVTATTSIVILIALSAEGILLYLLAMRLLDRRHLCEFMHELGRLSALSTLRTRIGAARSSPAAADDDLPRPAAVLSPEPPGRR